MSRYNLHLVVHELAKHEGMNAGQIAARLNVSVKTVRRHLAAERWEPPKRRAIPLKLDPYKELVKQLLEREQYTAAQVFQRLKEEGYTGCESVLRTYVALVRPRRQTPYLTLNFEPAQTAQVDFAECGTISVGETRRKLHAFVMTLCHSRMVFVKFIMRESMEHFLQCHREAFEYFHGLVREVMVDNCKVAVKTSSLYGAPLPNERYADCAAHYGFKIVPCGVRKPQEKGRVERSVGFLRSSYLNGLDLERLTLAALNHGVRQWMENVANVRVHGATHKTPLELFQLEKAALLPLPTFPYDCGVVVAARLNSQYRVVFESNRYSAPPELAGRRVELAVYPERLLIRHEGKLVAEHERSYERGRDFGLPEHDNALLEQRRKAGLGILTKRFLELGTVAATYLQGLQTRRLNPGVHVRKIMALLGVHGRGELVRALEDAAASGAFGSDYIANLLEARRAVADDAGPLHLSRKSDLLDLDVEPPDMDAYDINQ
jgi:transposase